MMEAKLGPRVLVAVDHADVPAWHVEVVRLLIAGGACRVAVVQCPGDRHPERGVLRWLMRRIPALAPTPMPADFAALAWDGLSPDVLLDLRPADRQLAYDPVEPRVPRMRMISGERAQALEPLPFADEVVRGSRVTHVCLWLDRPDEGSGILFQGRWRTSPERFPRFVQSILEEIAAWPAAVLPRMAIRQPWEPGSDSPRSVVEVGAGRLLWAVLASVARRIAADLFRHEHWTVGIAPVPIQHFLDASRPIRIDWRGDAGRSGYLADPFGTAAGGTCKLLVERFDYRLGRGEIASLAFDVEQGWSAVESSFRPPLHLSYPFIVEEQGNLYVLPECCESGRVVLYAVTPDLGDWREAAVLVADFPGVDGTLFRCNGKWWLFATSKAAGADSHLYAWYSEQLLGPWAAHAHNPIKIDVASARPGGTPFVHEGKLYRPAQDCSRTYGGSIVIQEITRLDPQEFEERFVRRVNPESSSRWSKGFHTLSGVGDAFTVVDAKREVFSPLAAVANLRNTTTKIARHLVSRPE